MSLTLYYHPLASYCHKVLVALYEHGIDFEKRIVDLSDEGQRAELQAIWPVGKFPVLRDHARDRDVPEIVADRIRNANGDLGGERSTLDMAYAIICARTTTG